MVTHFAGYHIRLFKSILTTIHACNGNAAESREKGSAKPIFDSIDRYIGVHSLRVNYACELLKGIERGDYERERLLYKLSNSDIKGVIHIKNIIKIAMAQD